MGFSMLHAENSGETENRQKASGDGRPHKTRGHGFRMGQGRLATSNMYDGPISPPPPPSPLPLAPLTLVEISGYGAIYCVSGEGQNIAQEADPAGTTTAAANGVVGKTRKRLGRSGRQDQGEKRKEKVGTGGTMRVRRGSCK